MTTDPSDLRLRTAVIGAGRMGAIHARVYSRLPSSRLVAVVDIDLARARQLAQANGCQAYDDPSQILDKVDAVTIATPTPTHLQLAGLFIARRIPVLVEKPLASTVPQARRIVELAKRYQTLVAVGHSERYNPVVLAMRPYINRPRYIEAIRVSPFPFRSTETSVVLDMMIHDIDIALSLVCSPVRQVHAIGVGIVTDNQDLCSARLLFDNGSVASLTASRLALKKERRIRVFTERAYLSVDCLNKAGTVIRLEANALQLERIRRQLASGQPAPADLDWTSLVRMEHLDIQDAEPVLLEQQAFLDAIIGRPGLPIVRAEEGLAALSCAARIINQIRKHRWPQ